jgi:hypothetical protein
VIEWNCDLNFNNSYTLFGKLPKTLKKQPKNTTKTTLKTRCNLGGLGVNGKEREKERKRMSVKGLGRFYRVVNNFLGLQGQE